VIGPWIHAGRSAWQGKREASSKQPDHFPGVVMAKKCGVGSSDPSLHSQPRLPGSVVGEASMR
jgi:hypothetical protein